MLVLARKSGESVQIGDHVELRVLSVSGKRVRLGVVCPQGLRIMRTEVIERQLTAAGGRSPDTAPISAVRPVVSATPSAGRAGAIRELSPPK